MARILWLFCIFEIICVAESADSADESVLACRPEFRQGQRGGTPLSARASNGSIGLRFFENIFSFAQTMVKNE
jgi:hypothetical protein